MRKISRCLNKQLIDICLKSVDLDKLNVQIVQFLPAQLRAHCQVISFQKGCLTLSTDNAVWATELRYCLPELRDDLRKKAGLHQLISIKLTTAIPIYQQNSAKPARKKPILSAQASDVLLTAGQQCPYEPLKNALINLSNRKPSKI